MTSGEHEKATSLVSPVSSFVKNTVPIIALPITVSIVYSPITGVSNNLSFKLSLILLSQLNSKQLDASQFEGAKNKSNLRVTGPPWSGLSTSQTKPVQMFTTASAGQSILSSIMLEYSMRLNNPGQVESLW